MQVPIIRRQRPDFTPSYMPSDPDRAARDQISPFKSADDALTHAIGVMVYSLFPGHPWMIYADHEQGVVVISIPALMGPTKKMVIPIKRLCNEAEARRNVSNICGEILERYRIPRAGFDQDEFLRALGDIPIHRRSYHGFVPE
jgi:hypothetical protein